MTPAVGTAQIAMAASLSASNTPAVDSADFSQSLPATSSPMTESAALDAVELPKPVVSTSPVVPLGQAVAGVLEDSAESITDDSLDLLSGMFAQDTDVQASGTSSDSDSSLDDIRQRMALIESAGQLDIASVVVVPPAPVQVIATVSGSTTESTDAGPPLLAQVGALEGINADTDSNADLLASKLASADTASRMDPQASAPVETEGALPPVSGAFANVLQDLRKESGDTLVDHQTDGLGAVSGAGTVTGDAQGSFNLASLGLDTTGLIGTGQAVNHEAELSPAIGTTAWQDGLGQQVIDMLKRGEKQVDLRLNPTELGPLSISLNLNEGNTQAQFQSAHASVRVAVEQALPQLRDALASQGITLGQTSVGDDSSRSSDQSQRDSQSSGASPAPSRGTDAVSQVNELPAPKLVVRAAGVDLYV